MKVYDFIKENYEINEPIFLYEVDIDNKSSNAIKLEFRKLLEEEKLKKYDRGIYYMPGKGPFGIETSPTIDDVVTKKYLKTSSGKTIGYISGINFANNLRLTTQSPMSITIRSNLATKDIEEKTINGFRLIIKRPRTIITDDNYAILQLLDLFTDIEYIEDEFYPEILSVVKKYMKNNNITIKQIKNYYQYYPNKIFKNMYILGILNETI